MRSNPKIEEIKLTTKQLEEIVSLMKRDSLTTEVKNPIIKRYAGVVCLICGDVTTGKCLIEHLPSTKTRLSLRFLN